jgi:hypothetical protein
MVCDSNEGKEQSGGVDANDEKVRQTRWTLHTNALHNSRLQISVTTMVKLIGRRLLMTVIIQYFRPIHGSIVRFTELAAGQNKKS